jgi:release factor glutamine methyltransferase
MIALPAAPSISLRELRTLARDALKAAGIDNYGREADWLLAHAFGVGQAAFLSQHERTVPADRARHAWAFIKRRAAREPLQYILGTQEFRRLEIVVTPDVLIPRPETELLVEEAVNTLVGEAPLVADVGTGSGCIAVAVACESPQATVYAFDVSRPALQVARINAARHGVLPRLRFIQADLLLPLKTSPTGIFHMILANPPYIAEAQLDRLQPEVSRYEPRLALAAGPDGLAYYRRLLESGSLLLKPGGYLILELGFGQANAVGALAEADKRLSILKCRSDGAGIDRVLMLKRVA